MKVTDNKIGSGSGDSPASTEGFKRPLAPSEYCQLIMSGLTEDDIKRLMKEGLIG